MLVAQFFSVLLLIGSIFLAAYVDYYYYRGKAGLLLVTINDFGEQHSALPTHSARRIGALRKREQ